MSRRGIYYWKCDRPAAFHGTQPAYRQEQPEVEPLLREALSRHFHPRALDLRARPSQGNHLTWNADVDGQPMFIRVENGPEHDDHLAVESALIEQVRAIGIPTPRVFGHDATRSSVPFAWQALERIEAPDLNHWYKRGTLNVPRIAFDLGAAVAKWQQLQFAGFGPLNADLRGCHARYADYFHVRLDEHLNFLAQRGFLTTDAGAEIRREVEAHRNLLALETGCFVHKDLALWNVLGSERDIVAFIDFDDTISGDPMDDLSLLGCFHDTAFLRRAFEGYESLRPLPAEHRRRFWLHLLRNMIVKAVIRVGGNYFQRDDSFFLVGAGMTGTALREFTETRLQLALNGLRRDAPLDCF